MHLGESEPSVAAAYGQPESPKVFWPRYVRIAISYYGGSVDSLAAALKCTPAAIYQWSTVPKGRAYQLEVITGGGLRAYELNPACDRAPDVDCRAETTVGGQQ